MLITLDLTGEEIKVLKDVTSNNGIGAHPHSIYNSTKDSLYSKVKHALIISTNIEASIIKTDAVGTTGCKVTISTKDC